MDGCGFSCLLKFSLYRFRMMNKLQSFNLWTIFLYLFVFSNRLPSTPTASLWGTVTPGILKIMAKQSSDICKCSRTSCSRNHLFEKVSAGSSRMRLTWCIWPVIPLGQPQRLPRLRVQLRFLKGPLLIQLRTFSSLILGGSNWQCLGPAFSAVGGSMRKYCKHSAEKT